MVYQDLLGDPEKRERIIRAGLGIGEEEVPERVVVSPILLERVLPPGFLGRMEEMGIRTEERVPEDYMLRVKNYLVEWEGERGAFLVLGRGIVEFTDRLSILFSIPSVKEALFLGSGASLQDHIATGDLNVPKYVIPMERESEVYVNPLRSPPVADEDLWGRVGEIAEKYGKVHRELHATVPFFYMETRELLEYLRGIGVGTLDMELSAFYRVARDRKVRAVGVIRAGDKPLHGGDVFDPEYEKVRREGKRRALEAMFRTSLEFLFPGFHAPPPPAQRG